MEFYFIIPRQELQSGRSFNPFPPGWQKNFHPFEKWCNVRYGWAQPDAPCRARAVSPGLDALKYASDMSNQDKIYFKKVLSAYILDLCMQRKIMRLDYIICLLKNFCYTIPRCGKDYITVKAPGSGQRIRLKGDVFEENFYSVDFLNNVKKEEIYICENKSAEFYWEEMEKSIAIRGKYNEKRYKKQMMLVMRLEKMKKGKRSLTNWTQQLFC